MLIELSNVLKNSTQTIIKIVSEDHFQHKYTMYYVLCIQVYN